ncbi:MAG: DUF523 domain-containing protein [Anaerolineaceae bacterium]|jgi:uncharacterized protein YbbK (DUF523 family)
MIIVSACLAGVQCRYDGAGKPCEAVICLVAVGKAIPVCPEQLGGLTTPRLSSEIRGDRVVRKDGVDVTEEFERGAHEALRLAQLVGAKAAILKSRSPSCGVGKIYDGTFSGKVVDGDGVFTALCRKNGIEVKTEEEL